MFEMDAPPGPLLCVNFEWPMSPKAARPFFLIRMYRVFHNYLIVINSETHIKRDTFLYIKTPTVVSRHGVQYIYSVDMLERSKYSRTIRILPHCQRICSHLLVASLYSLLSWPMSLAIYLNQKIGQKNKEEMKKTRVRSERFCNKRDPYC